MGINNLFEKVYRVVKNIPKGKVASYGQIAKLARVRGLSKRKITPRMVGIALHKNPDPENIPCHRVVNKDGRIAENYAFGGWKKQKKKLLVEGVKFIDEMHVDLEKFFWKP